MKLDDKRVVVTGGVRGIGTGVVKVYAAQGAHVASFDVLDESGR